MPMIEIENQIEKAEKKIEAFQSQRKDDLPVTEDDLQTFTQVIDSIQSSINKVGKEENLETDDRKKLHFYYSTAEKMWRMAELLYPRGKEEFQKSLWWYIEQGGRNELSTLKIVKNNPPYSDLELKELLEKAQKAIEAKLLASGVYQIFCSESELRGLLPEIEIIEKYEAFLFIVLDDEETVPQIKTQYPVEKIESLPSLELTEDLGEPQMLKKEQVVKFKFPVREDWKKRIQDTNAEILQPLGNSEFVISIPNEEILAQINSFREVASVTPYEPNIRVREEYLEMLGQEITEDMLAEAHLKIVENSQNNIEISNIIPGILIASFFTEEDCNQAIHTLESQEIDIVEQPDNYEIIVDLINHSNPRNAYEILKNLPGLRSLEEESIETNCNFGSVFQLTNGNGTSPNICGLSGEGETIAIADTGLDLGEANIVHPDFAGRVRAIESYPIRPSESNRVRNPGSDNGASDRYSGHGTHVAGSALGSGEMAQKLGLPPISGMAPGAELIFQAVEQTPRWTIEQINLFLGTGRIPPASDLLGIPSNLRTLFESAYSQGAYIHSNSWGGSEQGSYNRRCHQVDEFVWQNKHFLIVFAAGNSGSRTGTVTPPGTAKNCITVGALDDFSSRGPCQNGRRKPDVIAPGKFILSTRSRQITHYSEASFPPAQKFYMYMSGTSMSTPLVAGCAALVRQYLRTQTGVENPSAALLKAALIHSAEYISSYPNTSRTSNIWADNEQGWGRINLSGIINLTSPHQIVFLDQPEGFSCTGQQHQYRFNITDSSIPLRVTLVYTDYPAQNLVNNLNLLVHSPTNKYYLGNDFLGTGSKDNVNNVEGCIVELPELGRWTVKIVGSEISQPPQDYALVVSGGFADLQEV